MIDFHSKIWPAIESIRSRWGPIHKLDLLTGYLGAGAVRVLDELGHPDTRLVFGLSQSNPELSQGQIDELELLKKAAQIRIFPGLHSKLYLFDSRVLALGSANF